MKRTLALFTVLLAITIFAMPTYAGRPPGPEEGLTVNVLNEVEIKNDTGNLLPVDVVNEPTVHIGSMPAGVEREPFHLFVDRGFDDGLGGDFLVYTVPLGKRLVIEFVSTFIKISDSAKVANFYIGTGEASPQINYFTPPIFKFYDDLAFSESHYRGSEKVLIHAGPNDQVWVGIVVDGPDSPVNYQTSISGYLVPVSTP